MRETELQTDHLSIIRQELGKSGAQSELRENFPEENRPELRRVNRTVVKVNQATRAMRREEELGCWRRSREV